MKKTNAKQSTSSQLQSTNLFLKTKSKKNLQSIIIIKQELMLWSENDVIILTFKKKGGINEIYNLNKLMEG